MNKLITLIILLFLNVNLQSQSLESFEYSWEAKDQRKTERVIDDELLFEAELLSLENLELFEFAYLDSDERGNLIGYDYTKERIIFFPEGDYKNILELTDGIGRGPKELKLPRDLKFDKAGFIWVIDLEGGKIQKWNRKNELVTNFKPDIKYIRPYRISVCDKSVYILSEQYLGEGLYHKYDFKGSHQSSFKTVKSENDREFRLWIDASYFRGDLACDDDKLIHVGRYKNYIRMYDETGDLLFSNKVIEFDGNEEPLLTIGKRSSSRKENVKEISGNVEVINDKILVSFSGRKNYHFYLLDIYDLNGQYLKSFKFKHPTKEFTTDGKYIYTLETHRDDRKQYLSKYKLPDLN